MREMECWVKDSNHGESKRADLKLGFKDSDKMVVNRLSLCSIYLLATLNLAQSKLVYTMGPFKWVHLFKLLMFK